MAGVLTLLSVLYGVAGISVTVLAALLVRRYAAEFACNSGGITAERGVTFVARPRPETLRRKVLVIGACFLVGLAALIVFAVAGLGLDRPTFSTHYTLKVLGRTYEEANVALFALLPVSAAGCAALGAFSAFRRLRVLSVCRVCLTDGGLYGMSYEPQFLGCGAQPFELRLCDLTRLRAEERAVVLEARARAVRVPVAEPQALLAQLGVQTAVENL